MTWLDSDRPAARKCMMALTFAVLLCAPVSSLSAQDLSNPPQEFDVTDEVQRALHEFEQDKARLLVSVNAGEPLDLAILRPGNTIVSMSAPYEKQRLALKKSYDKLITMKQTTKLEKARQLVDAHIGDFRRKYSQPFLAIAARDLVRQISRDGEMMERIYLEQVERAESIHHAHIEQIKRDAQSKREELASKVRASMANLEPATRAYQTAATQLELLDEQATPEALERSIHREKQAMRASIQQEVERAKIQTVDRLLDQTGISRDNAQCIQNARNERDAAACLIPDAPRRCLRAAARGKLTTASAIESQCGEDLPKPARDALEIMSCQEKYGDDYKAVAACTIADDLPIGAKEAQFVACASSSTSIMHCIDIPGLNDEGKIILECAVEAGGNPKATLACSVGKLTERELSKCLEHGVGGEGCFGDGNFARQAFDEVHRTVESIFGSDNELFKAYDLVHHNVLSPGSGHEAVRLFNTIIKERERVLQTVRALSASVVVTAKEVERLTKNTEREAARAKKNVDRELTKAREDAQRELESFVHNTGELLGDVAKGTESLPGDVARELDVLEGNVARELENLESNVARGLGTVGAVVSSEAGEVVKGAGEVVKEGGEALEKETKKVLEEAGRILGL